MGYGTKMEPLLALGIAALWGIYGGFHFLKSGRASGKTALIETRPTSA
jgi:hypothetical protein